MRNRWAGAYLLGPGVFLLTLLLVLPLVNTVVISFQQFLPGWVGTSTDAPFTVQNYVQLLNPAYWSYIWQTLWISFVAAMIALVVGFPVAYIIARSPSGWLRKVLLTLLVIILFLGTVVRVYAIALTFGPVGFLMPIARFFDLNPNGDIMIKLVTIVGLLHYGIPMSGLILVGTIRHINPDLAEAAEALGACRWKAHLTVTVPLAKRGLVEAFLVTYALSISAFIIPMILGEGRLLFVANLIFSRFSLVANYPGGAALSIGMTGIALAVMYLVVRLSSTGE